MDDLDDVVKDNAAFRKQKAAECGIGFELPSSVSIAPNVPKTQPKQRARKLRKVLDGREKDWSGREDLNLRPPGPEPGALPG
jgi:hypothetical protein